MAQQPDTVVVDQDEQLMGFVGLLRSVDERIDQINAMHVWQWGMPGTNGSHFYMDPDLTSNIGGGFDESLNTPTAAWLANFVSNPLVNDPDFNDDGQINGVDIDMLVENIAIGPSDPGMFDLNADGDVDLLDRDEWLIQAGAANLPSANPYFVGDANLDGVVDGLDFIDWNDHKFMSANRVLTVPAPGTATMSCIALILLGMARVRCVDAGE